MLNKWSKVILDAIYENSANKLPSHKEIEGWKWTKPEWSLSFELDKNGDELPGNGKKGALSIDPTSGTFDVVVQTFDVPIMRIGGTNSIAVVLGGKTPTSKLTKKFNSRCLGCAALFHWFRHEFR